MQQLLKYSFLVCCLIFIGNKSFAQLSPGDLTNAHKNLEGLTKCVDCHVLGEKETTSKCLECHKEIQHLIDQRKGYHSSLEVKGKKCAACHGEHFGRNFQIIRFDENSFKHDLTGYKLEGKHKHIKCVDCHKTELIINPVSQKRGSTFLGLGNDCLSCHKDYHQETLSKDCISCHNQNTFRPAPGFNHNNTRYKLVGAHQQLECIACHKIENRNGVLFQEFVGIEFESCTSCHNDVHQNKFGNDCRKCHTEVSFKQVKNLSTFNHEKTAYPLRGKHRAVDCKSCHKGSYTKPLKHKLCADCHNNFHENQFAKNGASPDCVECHSIKGFSPSSYTLQKHNESAFPLEGAHLATPCFACHKTTEKWNFAELGKCCIDCHGNIHKDDLDEKFMPDSDCKSCHSNSVWTEISFDHKKTDFPLLGKHENVNCRDCHFTESQSGKMIQQFKELTKNCESCHLDIHYKQFVVKGENDCSSCHGFNNWKAEKYNHNKARFKLDGKHADVDCVRCHKPNDNLIQNYTVYKFKDISCESCHL